MPEEVLSGVHGDYLCGKRAGPNFLNLLRPSDKTTDLAQMVCPDGYQNCGNDETDATDYCTPIGEECPINDLMFFPPDTEIDPEQYEDSLTFSDGYILAYSRTAARLPLVQFVNTEKAVCSDKEQIE